MNMEWDKPSGELRVVSKGERFANKALSIIHKSERVPDCRSRLNRMSDLRGPSKERFTSKRDHRKKTGFYGIARLQVRTAYFGDRYLRNCWSVTGEIGHGGFCYGPLWIGTIKISHFWCPLTSKSAFRMSAHQWITPLSEECYSSVGLNAWRSYHEGFP